MAILWPAAARTRFFTPCPMLSALCFFSTIPESIFCLNFFCFKTQTGTRSREVRDAPTSHFEFLALFEKYVIGRLAGQNEKS